MYNENEYNENIIFTLSEQDKVSDETQELTLSDFFYYDIEQLKFLYTTHYTIKNLQQILQYYGLQKNKMVKDEMIQVLLFFETDKANQLVVERRLRLWQNIQELKADPYFSKYILF
jgi:hypothetical protein